MSDPKILLTPAMVRGYIASDGGHCPFRHRLDIEGGRLDAEGECALGARVACLICNRK